MPRMTDQQARERAALIKAVSTVTKVEPQKFAQNIHNTLIACREHGLNVEDSVKDLELDLRTMHVYTTTSDKWGNWIDRKHRLTPKQQETILTFLTFSLTAGMEVGMFDLKPHEAKLGRPAQRPKAKPNPERVAGQPKGLREDFLDEVEEACKGERMAKHIDNVLDEIGRETK